jgi:hypothetical protein
MRGVHIHFPCSFFSGVEPEQPAIKMTAKNPMLRWRHDFMGELLCKLPLQNDAGQSNVGHVWRKRISGFEETVKKVGGCWSGETRVGGLAAPPDWLASYWQVD